MNYLICQGCYYIARTQIDRFTVRDYIAPMYRCYNGVKNVYQASQALLFDTIDAAKDYIRRSTLIPDDWSVKPYNVTCNCLEV